MAEGNDATNSLNVVWPVDAGSSAGVTISISGFGLVQSWVTVVVYFSNGD